MQLCVGRNHCSASSVLAIALRKRNPKNDEKWGINDKGDNEGRWCKELRFKKAMDVLHDPGKKQYWADFSTCALLLQGCAKTNGLAEGKQVHAHMIKTGIGSDVYLGNNLVAMYTKCGSAIEAHQVFEEMPERNVVSWTSMIAAYAQHGCDHKAFRLFCQMQQEGVKPDQFTLSCVIRACTRLSAPEQGKQVHAHIIKEEFEPDVSLCSALVDFYAKCGSVVYARRLFDELPNRNVVLWTAMIGGYAHSGHDRKALELLREMRSAGIQPNEFTFGSVLRACASLAALDRGKELHSCSIKTEFELDTCVASALVAMYSKCGSAEDARIMFDRIHDRTVVSWNARISGFAQVDHGEEALKFFSQMQLMGVNPDLITFAIVLGVCCSMKSVELGKQVHVRIIKFGFETDVSIGNALITLYVKFGSTENACRVFHKMPERNVISWNAMIAGYTQNEHAEEALTLLRQMQQRGLKANEFTLPNVIRACASLEALDWGKQFHANIIRAGFESDIFVGSALVDMYGKCASIEDAHKLFDHMPEQNTVSWNALATGYSQNGHAEDALKLFWQMHREDVKMDEVTFTTVLSACATLATMELGKEVHVNIIKTGFESDVSVGNALVSMYSKCGSIDDASIVFNKMPTYNMISWNAMITGYAQHGLGKEALKIFEQMQGAGFKPDQLTFICVLSVCSHVGLVDEGRHYFNSMSQNHGIIPRMEHYACMVDLLGRAGCLDEAEDFIDNMPFEPGALIWRTLLGACKIYGNIELGRHAAKSIFALKPQDAAAYVLLSNIYAADGRWHDVANVRKLMKNRLIEKEPGHSWIEIKNKVHAFVVRD